MRDAMTGALVVVGGHSRGVGKTLVVEHLLRAHRAEGWIAIKVSAHRHAAAGRRTADVEEAFAARSDTQTGRYRAAGAGRAFLVRAPEASLPGVADLIDASRADGSTVVVESNRIVRHTVPDVVLFVVDPYIQDWKASSPDCLAIADAIVCARPRVPSPRAIHVGDAGRAARPLFMTADPRERERLSHWLSLTLAARRGTSATSRLLAS
jgi:molybdopterin-guanine dinucleotide biosynthesis protein